MGPSRICSTCSPGALSRIYDGALASEHLADLRKRDLTDETIEDTLGAWQAERVPAIALRDGMEARLGQRKTELVQLTNALAGWAPPASVHEAIQARERYSADQGAQLEHLAG